MKECIADIVIMDETNASNIEGSMVEIDSLWDWNETMHQFIGFPITPFNITIGDGFFVHVASDTTWNGGI